MKVFQNKNKIVFVASLDHLPGCPRIILNSGNATMRDDYHNKVKIKSSLVKNLF